MVTAAETVPGTDPDRAATIALQTAIYTVTPATAWSPAAAWTLAGSAARSWTACSRPACRVSVRKVKSPLSRWDKADPHRPAHSTPVTAIGITLQHAPQQQSPARRQ